MSKPISKEDLKELSNLVKRIEDIADNYYDGNGGYDVSMTDEEYNQIDCRWYDKFLSDAELV